jgi:hypothetical protein
MLAQIQGNIVAPPSTAVNKWGSVRNDYWLKFSRVDGLRVTGNGVIDGNGQSWWIRRCGHVVSSHHASLHAFSTSKKHLPLQAPNNLFVSFPPPLPQGCVQSAPTVCDNISKYLSFPFPGLTVSD